MYVNVLVISVFLLIFNERSQVGISTQIREEYFSLELEMIGFFNNNLFIFVSNRKILQIAYL